MKSAAMRDVFGQALVDLAPTHPELVVLDADVSSSTKTSLFGKACPERFFNVGVAETNMVDIAAGLATCGFRPVVSTFALFLASKTAEQIRNSICYNNLPVIIAGGYAGLSDSYDGASHQAIEDLAIMRALPNLAVLSPGDPAEVKSALEAALQHNGPVYLRLSRNATPVLFEDAAPFQIGRNRTLREGADVTLLATGVPVYLAAEAAKQLAARNIQATVISVSSLKPLDEDSILAAARKTGLVVTVEEHSILGGLGGAVAELLSEKAPTRMTRIGLHDRFGESGDYAALMAKHGISVAGIVEQAERLIRERPSP
jgi:transketolase